MNIRILSDLHFEHQADGGKDFVDGQNPRGVDLLILAGDITRMDVGIDKSLALFRRRFDCPIVFVHGNHEFHKSDRATVLRATKNAINQFKGVHWLDCNIVEIAGRRILGTPLWYGKSKPPPGMLSTDEEWAKGHIRMWNPKTSSIYEDRFADFEKIENLDTWVYDENARAIKFLDENMREGDIVVTHMLPSPKSVPPMFERSYSNAFFCTDVTPFIEERKPALFVHGHTHTSHDYLIGPTRVVCNPFGYVNLGALNADFEDDLTIDLP